MHRKKTPARGNQLVKLAQAGVNCLFGATDDKNNNPKEERLVCQNRRKELKFVINSRRKTPKVGVGAATPSATAIAVLSKAAAARRKVEAALHKLAAQVSANE
jgi:hypothetical protein